MEIKALPAQNENEKKHFIALMFVDGAEDEDLGDASSTDDDRTNSGNVHVKSAAQSGDNVSKSIDPVSDSSGTTVAGEL